MDFIEIDRVLGDSVTVGDIIVSDTQEYHQIRRFDEDAWEEIVFSTYNLSTGDEDVVLINPDKSYPIFQVQ